MAQKPKRNDFGPSRQGASRYRSALRTWRNSQKPEPAKKVGVGQGNSTARRRNRRSSTAQTSNRALKVTTPSKRSSFEGGTKGVIGGDKSGATKAQQERSAAIERTAAVKARAAAKAAAAKNPPTKAPPAPKLPPKPTAPKPTASKPKQKPTGKSDLDKLISGAKTFISTYKDKKGKEGMQAGGKKMKARVAKLQTRKKLH